MEQKLVKDSNTMNYSQIKWAMVHDARGFGLDYHTTGMNPNINIWGGGARRLARALCKH